MDLTQGPLVPLLLRLAWPTVLYMLLFQALSVVDLLFIKQLGTSEATAAVGVSTFSISLVLNLLNFGIGMGTSAMVARRRGEGRMDQVQVMIRQSVMLIAVLGIFLGWPLAWYAPQLLQAMGQSPEVAAYAGAYVQIYASCFFFCLQIVAFRSAMQGLGDTLTPTLLLGGANLINALLDWVLVTGVGPFPRMEVAGLAVGTVTAQTLQALVAWYLLRGGRYWGRTEGRWGWKRYPFQLVWTSPAVDWPAIRAIWSIGWPGGMQGVIRSFAFLVLLGLAEQTSIGASAVAAFTAGIQAEAIGFLPVVGLATACVSMVGQNLGAGFPDRAEEAARLAAWVAFWYLLLTSAIFLLFPTQLVQIFLGDSDPWAVYSGAMYLYLTGFAEWTLFVIVLGSALRAGGDAQAPFVIQILGQYVIRLPLAWALLKFTSLDSIGLWIAVNVSMLLEAGAVLIRFRQGHWKRRKL
ncbi:MAG: putative FMN/FAD exporter YeeO [bacterium]|nr:putative FMN/FAD exporter YeeO [bacterium]